MMDQRQNPTITPEGNKRKLEEDIQLAKQKAQEIAARLSIDAESKRPRLLADDNSFSKPPVVNSNLSPVPFPGSVQKFVSPLAANTQHESVPLGTALGQYHSSQASSKIMAIPNGKVGVVIGKGGETIKYIQLQSGAKIQITRDSDADPYSPTRDVELMGTQQQIERAEELINNIIKESDLGGTAPSDSVQPGSEQIVLKVPNNKVASLIGKGGETIRNIQSQSGARIQIIPLHLPPGDTSTERNVYINGQKEQIESAKEMINEVISVSRPRYQSGGYVQPTYPPPANWAPPGQPPPQQQPGYGYAQPGASFAPPPYYGGYPTQTASSDQSSTSAVPPPAPPQQTPPYYGGYPAPVVSSDQSSLSTVPPPQQPPTYYGGYPTQPAGSEQSSSSTVPPPPQQPSPYYGGYATQPAISDQSGASIVPPPPQQPGYYYYGQQGQMGAAPPNLSYSYGYAHPPTISGQSYDQNLPQKPSGQEQDTSNQTQADGQKPHVSPKHGATAVTSQPDGTTTDQSAKTPIYPYGYNMPAAPVQSGYGTAPAYMTPALPYAAYGQMGYPQSGYGVQQSPGAFPTTTQPIYGQSGSYPAPPAPAASFAKETVPPADGRLLQPQQGRSEPKSVEHPLTPVYSSEGTGSRNSAPAPVPETYNSGN